MVEHPVIALARSTAQVDGAGLELTNRPFGRGVYLRLWIPDLAGARVVQLTATSVGLAPGLPMPHLNSIDALEYDGYQLVIGVPAHLVATLRDAMTAAQAIAGPRPELTP